ncbi:MAG TPA: hypothetical protein VFH95_05195 [Candidatus Kapabacteria bacterium]|nr:hypothetical protein [Candidatus Kapabacteria bacterium]
MAKEEANPANKTLAPRGKQPESHGGYLNRSIVIEFFEFDFVLMVRQGMPTFPLIYSEKSIKIKGPLLNNGIVSSKRGSIVVNKILYCGVTMECDEAFP